MSSTTPAAEPLPLQRAPLRVSQPDDPLEKEAEEVADRVMRMPSPEVGLIQRCPGGGPDEEMLRRQVDEEEDPVQLQEMEEEDEIRTKPLRVDRPRAVAPGTASSILARRGFGSPLPLTARRFFEPRLGVDLSKVKVHQDTEAARLSTAINARAFTLGRDVFFGADEWSPGTPGGDRLIAHELAHALQGPAFRCSMVRRSVGPASSCKPSAHGAGADPLDQLKEIDSDAQRMALGASHMSFLASIEPASYEAAPKPTYPGDPQPSSVMGAFRSSFGDPEPVDRKTGQKFRSRIGGKLFDSKLEATSHELNGLSGLLEKLSGWIAADITYKCPGKSPLHAAGCKPTPCGANHAIACTKSRTLGICPPFWSDSRSQQAPLVAHEVMHWHGFTGHPTTRRGRIRNPACIQQFIQSIYVGSTGNSKCPPP